MAIAQYWHQGQLRDENDCTLRALEFVTGMPYPKSQRLAQSHGYIRGRGMPLVEFIGLLWNAAHLPKMPTLIGHQWLNNLTVTEFAQRYPGRWVLWTKQEMNLNGTHAIGLVDHKLDGEQGYEAAIVLVAIGLNH